MGGEWEQQIQTSRSFAIRENIQIRQIGAITACLYVNWNDLVGRKKLDCRGGK